MDLVTRLDCPACGQPGGDLVYSSPYDEGPVAEELQRAYGDRLDVRPVRGSQFDLVRCANCRTVRQRLVPDEEYLVHIYGEAALAQQERTAAARDLSVRRSWAEQVEMTVGHFGGRPEQIEALDFGAGSGAWLRMAAAYGCRTSGVELSEPARCRLAAAGHDTYSPNEVPISRFHLVNSEQVLEHLVDPAAALARIAGALRPGGVVRVAVPNGTDIVERLATPDWSIPKGAPRSLNPVAPLEHLNCFSRTGLDAMAARVGLVPFEFPLREVLRPSTRVRTAMGAVRRRLVRPKGTLQWYQRPT